MGDLKLLGRNKKESEYVRRIRNILKSVKAIFAEG